MEYDKFQIEPFGVHVAHTWLEVGVVLDTINRLGIKRFVEIGIYKGGLAALLVHTTKHIPGFEYLGIEIDSQIVEPTVRKLFDPLANATLWLRDAHARETIESVRQWIARKPGPALIYCDGGDKPKEFTKYAPIVRVNDFIAAHDWDYGGYSRAEIKPRDIEKPIYDNNLSQIGFTEPIRIGLWKRV
jgi:hypothetical protein